MTLTASTKTSKAMLDRIRGARAAGQSLLLLSDYDGTLTEIAERPDLAQLSPVTRTILHQLAEQPGIHVGIISGRRIDDLRQLVALDQLLLAGTSGLELDLAGKVISPPEADFLRAMIADTACLIRECLAREPGAWVEEKPFGLTLQLAGTSRDSRQRIRKWLDDELLTRNRRLRFIDCALGIEIIPEIGLTKATAIRRFLEHIRVESVLVVFAGNDTNDAEALALTTELGGIAIGIGSNAPLTDHHFLEPAQFICVLAELLNHLD